MVINQYGFRKGCGRFLVSSATLILGEIWEVVSMNFKKYCYTKAFLIPALLVYGIFFILPNVIGLALGFTNWSTHDITNIKFTGLDNFSQLLNEPIFLKSVGNTFYYTIVTVIVSNVLAFLLAIVMVSKLKLRNFYRSVFFIPTTLSILVVAPVFKALYNPQKGLINSALRAVGLNSWTKEWLVDPKYAMNSVIVMSIWASIGLTIMLYITGLQAVPKDYYEAAEIDGCTFWKKLRHIALPLMIPSITVNFVLSIVNGLKVFTQVFALTNGGPNDATQVFGTLIFKNFGSGLLGYSSAVGLAFTIVVSVVAFVMVSLLRKMEVEY